MVTSENVLEVMTRDEIETCEFMKSQANIALSKLKKLQEDFDIADDVKKTLQEAIESKIKQSVKADERKQLCELVLSIFDKTKNKPEEK
jgi:hypothetical protein